MKILYKNNFFYYKKYTNCSYIKGFILNFYVCAIVEKVLQVLIKKKEGYEMQKKRVRSPFNEVIFFLGGGGGGSFKRCF